MKCFLLCVLCLFAFSHGMTIHLFDIAQQSSIEDRSLLARIFFTKNITAGEIGYNTELDGSVDVKPPDSSLSKFHSSEESSEEPEDPDDGEINEVFDSWSIVWYIASFSGLILFFLIVSCSEWCCRKHIRRQQQQQQQQQSQTQPQSTSSQTDNIRVIATRSQPEQQAPPSYDQFAPPSYESLICMASGGPEKKSEYEVYVVPVHAMTSMMGQTQTDGISSASAPLESPRAVPDEAPPSYAVVNLHTTETSSAHVPRC